MEGVRFIKGGNGEGKFVIVKDQDELARLIVSIEGAAMTAHHTEVFPKGEGKGLGKQLLAAMAEYSRKNGLKVQALCPFVYGQFKRHPAVYSDIWQTQ